MPKDTSTGDPAPTFSAKKQQPRPSKGPTGPCPKPANVLPHNKPSNTRESGKNLTQGEWLVVLDWYHLHEKDVGFGQHVTVAHFQQHGWKLSQSSLSRALARESNLRAEVAAVPNGAHSKRPRIVTEPRVDRALFEWHQEMEVRGEVVTGTMLVAKRAIFEEKLSVPEAQRLPGNGWVDSFKNA